MAKVASKVLDFESKGVEFEFAGKEPQLVRLEDFSPDIQLHFALHGMSQKLGDAYSASKGDVDVAQGLFTDTLNQLKNGEWRAARGEGDSKPRTTELADALARIKGLPVAEVQAALKDATDEQLKTMRSNERVKATIAVIRAEKAQARLEKLAAEGDIDDIAL
ncbi:hypothetical protein [Methylocaldum sp.]|uniref:hypothetical protein n=1 Tax=Methylocaldum sp. TaxID=1969727 RepID=UPI002D3C8602|nr:hypothetical protein [Methylocaldum sp.]HYE38141.1 hypothetical protein [Methylocaldum sp.]